MTKCDNCNGTGKIKAWMKRPKRHQREFTCPKCRGTGKADN